MIGLSDSDESQDDESSSDEDSEPKAKKPRLSPDNESLIIVEGSNSISSSQERLTSQQAPVVPDKEVSAKDAPSTVRVMFKTLSQEQVLKETRQVKEKHNKDHDGVSKTGRLRDQTHTESQTVIEPGTVNDQTHTELQTVKETLQNVTQKEDNVDVSSKPVAPLRTENSNRTPDDHVISSSSPASPFIDLSLYTGSSELEGIGLVPLRDALMALGLKCGGTLEQRAQRLWLTKGLRKDQFESSWLAPPTKKKN